jgi:hypothetical protein
VGLQNYTVSQTRRPQSESISTSLQVLSICTAGVARTIAINTLALLIYFFAFYLLQPKALARSIWDLKLNTVIPVLLACEKSNLFYHKELFFGLKMHVFPYATTLKRINENTDQHKLHGQHRTVNCIISAAGRKLLKF